MLAIQILLSLIYLYILKLSLKKDKLIFNVLFFLVSLYCFQLILAIADPYKVHTISAFTIICFNLQIIFIIIGGIAFYNKRSNKSMELHLAMKLRINKILLLIQTILLYISYIRFQRMQSFIKEVGNLTDQARLYYFTDIYHSYAEQFFFSIFDSFKIISYAVFFILIMGNERKTIQTYYMLFSTLLIAFISTITSMGRLSIVEILFIFLFFIFVVMEGRQKMINKKFLIYSIGIFASVVAVFFVITMYRNNSSDDFNNIYSSLDYFVFQPLITYFYVPVLAFDYGRIYIWGDLCPMFGAADFAGLIDLLLTPFVYIDHSIIRINGLLGSRMTPSFWFDSGYGWNALFTGGANYYIDFSFWGFIIFPFFLGWLLSLTSYKSKTSSAWLLALLILFTASYKNLFSSGIQSVSFFFSLLWLYYLKYKKILF